MQNNSGIKVKVVFLTNHFLWVWKLNIALHLLICNTFCLLSWLKFYPQLCCIQWGSIFTLDSAGPNVALIVCFMLNRASFWVSLAAFLNPWQLLVDSPTHSHYISFSLFSIFFPYAINHLILDVFFPDFLILNNWYKYCIISLKNAMLYYQKINSKLFQIFSFLFFYRKTDNVYTVFVILSIVMAFTIIVVSGIFVWIKVTLLY